MLARISHGVLQQSGADGRGDNQLQVTSYIAGYKLQVTSYILNHET